MHAKPMLYPRALNSHPLSDLISVSLSEDPPPNVPKLAAGDGNDTEEEPYKRRNQVLSVLVGLVAMLGYAFLSGIVSIQRQGPSPPGSRAIALDEEEEEEEA